MKLKSYIKKLNRRKLFFITMLGFLGMLLIAINFYWLYKQTPYNSDDVAQMVMLNYFHLGKLPSWMPPDPFIFKLPFNLVAQLFLGQTRHAIFLSAFLANVTSLFVFIFATTRIVSLDYRKNQQILNYITLIVPYLFIPSFVFMFSLRSPHIRTIEIGISFLIFWAVGKYWESTNNFRFKHLLISLFLFTLIFFNDPGYIFSLGLPILVVSIGKLLNKYGPKYAVSFFVILFAILFQKILIVILSLMGFKSYALWGNFVSLDKFGATFITALDALLKLFNADFFGRELANPATLVKVLFLPLILLGIYSATLVIKKGSDSHKLLSLSAVFATASYLFSNRATDPYSARYLIMLPFLFGPIVYIAVIKGYMPKVYARLATLSLTVILVMDFLIPVFRFASVSASTANPNQVNIMISKELSRNPSYSKGYAGYFMANINSYFNEAKVPITPILCDDGKARVFYWVLYEGYALEPADKSFVIASDTDLTPDITHNGPGIQCTHKEVIEMFGDPQREVIIQPGTSVLYYDYDIAMKLSVRTSTKNP